MLGIVESLLFIREVERLLKELDNCSDNQVCNGIRQDILLLLKALSVTARK